jgi:hypothetical protein
MEFSTDSLVITGIRLKSCGTDSYSGCKICCTRMTEQGRRARRNYLFRQRGVGWTKTWYQLAFPAVVLCLRLTKDYHCTKNYATVHYWSHHGKLSGGEWIQFLLFDSPRLISDGILLLQANFCKFLWISGKAAEFLHLGLAYPASYRYRRYAFLHLLLLRRLTVLVQNIISRQIWACYFERQPNHNNSMLEVQICLIHTSFSIRPVQ